MAGVKKPTRYYRVSGEIIPAPDLPCLYEDFARRVAEGEDVIPWPFADCEVVKPSRTTERQPKKRAKKR
jgi:hypothetical protein